MNKLFISILFFSLFGLNISAQSLEDAIDEEFKDSLATEVIEATFKSIRIINSHTIKNPPKNNLYMLISHRFGHATNGFSEFFGLDDANIRIGFEYGLSKKIAIGIGRSTFNKNYDMFAKYKLLSQKKEKKTIPLSLSILSVTNITSVKWPVSSRDYLFSHRISYTTQVLVARKFNNAISFQLMPTYIHKNLIESPDFENDIFAIGIGGRIKFKQRLALTYEYHYAIKGTDPGYYNPLSVGFDIETGSHVFQLFFTNAEATYDEAFITETSSNWTDKQFRFGFNILKTF